MAELEPTHAGYEGFRAERERARPPTDDEVAEFLRHMIVPTCGNLFHGVELKDDFPIPDFPELPQGTVLDIGCNWGRWSIAGALAGHKMVGIDVHLSSLLVARHLAEKLVPHNMPVFIQADARKLPFRDGVLDGVFSYSVVQHFSKANAARILSEVGRVLKPGGQSVIQMPNKRGIKAMLAGHGRTEGSEFDVRYYEVDELMALFNAQVGPSSWSVDCFFGLNVHSRDKRFVPMSRKWIVDAADAFKGASKVVPPLAHLADSVYLRSRKAA